MRTSGRPRLFRLPAAGIVLCGAVACIACCSPKNLPFTIIGVNVNEELRRFQIGPTLPDLRQGLGAVNAVGEAVANVKMFWTPMPDDFEPSPGVRPPITLLNPFRSQRFCMLAGALTFYDRDGSGFRGFGAGRTFPAEDGQGVLRIGAVPQAMDSWKP
jgi:hypothetical protein